MKAASGVDDMTTFITQARFTKDGFNGIIAAPEDRAEIVERLIARVGGKPIAHYLTSGEYDILLIFEAPSYEAMVPGLIVAGAGSGVADMRTVTALTSSEMKNAFVKAASLAASDRSAAAAAPPRLTSVEPQTTNPDTPPAGKTAGEDEDAKSATAILDAQKKAVEDTRAGRPAPYYFAPVGSAASSQPAASPRSTSSDDAARK
jgi:uncharacterized protein with GYD domain